VVSVVVETFLIWILFHPQETDIFNNQGYPEEIMQDSTRRCSGLYVVGYSRKGLSGCSSDAIKVATDISREWRQEADDASMAFSCKRKNYSNC
jgi:hypothetical protein